MQRRRGGLRSEKHFAAVGAAAPLRWPIRTERVQLLHPAVVNALLWWDAVVTAVRAAGAIACWLETLSERDKGAAIGRNDRATRDKNIVPGRTNAIAARNR